MLTDTHKTKVHGKMRLTQIRRSQGKTGEKKIFCSNETPLQPLQPRLDFRSFRPIHAIFFLVSSLVFLTATKQPN